MNVCDFVIHLDEHDGWLSAHGDGRPSVGEATNRIRIEELQFLKEYGSILQDDGPNLREAGVSLGAKLFHALFGNNLKKLFSHAMKEVVRSNSVLRIVLKYDLASRTDTSTVHEIPWELLYDPERASFLSYDENILLVRYLRGNGRMWEAPSRQLYVLLTTACPKNQQPLQFEKELEVVKSLLEKKRDETDFQELRHISGSRLIQAFNFARTTRSFHIWHHGGHGRDADGAFRLILHSKNGEPDSALEMVGAGAIAETVAGHPELQLVILNVCLGAGKRGLASLVADLDVPAVVGYCSKIQDQTAVKFASTFWRKLFIMPVDEAVQKTRAVIAGETNRLEFARVSLFLRSLDRPVLIEPELAAGSASKRMNRFSREAGGRS